MILLKNAKIYDGSGKDAFMGEVLVDGEKIAGVGEKLNAPEGAEVIDLNGRSLAPGFIDAHSHNDWFAIKKEPLKSFEPFIRQGITTFVTGNCGLSTIGFTHDSPHIDKVGGGLFFFNDTTGKYSDAEEYFEATHKKCPCNTAVLVGHCSARSSVAGYENRKLTPEEEQKMLDIMETSLKQGAAGISLGLMYAPGIFADKDELKKVAELCIKYDRPLTVHPRAESTVSMSYPELLGRSHLLRAIDELADIAKGTKLKLQCSHAIFVGRKSFKDVDEYVEIIDRLRAEGTDAMFDIYDETLGVSVITVILPPWYQGMSREERKKPLNRLKLSVLIKASSMLLGFGFSDILIAYIGKGYEKYEGLTVHQIAEMENMSDLDAYLMLCEVSDFKGRVNMGPYSTPDIIKRFSHNDNCLYMTDAWVEDCGVQNPAIYDCFPKFLRDSLMGFGDTMPKTIRKMSGASADRFSIADRGYIKQGYYADLTVFDEKEIKRGVPDRSEPYGIKTVFINGKKVLDNDELDREALKTSGMAVKINN